MGDEDGDEGDVGFLVGVHELEERVGMGGSGVVVGREGDSVRRCGGEDGGRDFKEGGIAGDTYEGEKLGGVCALRDALMGDRFKRRVLIWAVRVT